jgi:hypothetical protein
MKAESKSGEEVKKKSAGFIRLRRGLAEHLRWLSPTALKVYICFHFDADWKEGPSRGLVVTTQESLAEKLNLSIFQVRRALRELRPKYVTTVRRGNRDRASIFRIEKYEKLPSPDDTESLVSTNADKKDGGESLVSTLVSTPLSTGAHKKPDKPFQREVLQPSKKLEVRKKEEGITPTPLSAAKEYAFQNFLKLKKQQPSWTKADYCQLAQLFKRKPDLTEGEFRQRWDNFAASTDPFMVKQSLSLKFFCSNFDRFLEISSGRTIERSRHGREQLEHPDYDRILEERDANL